MKRQIAACAAMTLLSTCDSGAGDNSASRQSTSKLAAEMIVKVAPDQFMIACDSKDDIEEAVSHAVRHEATKLEGMMNAAKCVNIPPNLKFKILSVDEADGLIEFKGADSPATDGLWTTIETMKPA